MKSKYPLNHDNEKIGRLDDHFKKFEYAVNIESDGKEKKAQNEQSTDLGPRRDIVLLYKT